MAKYVITGNLYNSAAGGGQVNQARSYEASTAMQLLNSIKGAADTAQSISAVEFEKELKQREQAAIEQGMRDGSMGVSQEQYEADLREGDSIYDQAYNKAQKAAVAANISVLARTESARLAEMYKDDPNAYTGAQVGLFETIVTENDLDVNTQQILFEEMRNEASRYLPTITQNGYRKAKDAQFAAQRQEIEELQNVALNTIRGGDITKYRDDREQYKARLELMLSEGLINQSQYNESINLFDKEAQSQLVVGDVERSLSKGDVGEAIRLQKQWEKEARESGLMSPDEIDVELNRTNSMIASTMKELKKRYKDENTKLLSIDEVNQAINNGVGLYHANSADKKAVNSAFENGQMQLTPEGKVVIVSLPEGKKVSYDFSDPVQREMAVRFSIQTQVIPTVVKEQMQSTMYSNDPEIAARGLDMYNRLSEQQPEMLEQISSKDAAYAEKVNGLVNAGMPLKDAITQSKEFYKEDFSVRQKAIRDSYDKDEWSSTIDNNVDDYIDSSFDRSIFSSQPDAPILLKSDYERLFEHNLGMTGDAESAHNLTKKQLNKKWGSTYRNGEQTLIAYPPEKVLANSADEVEWIQEDWNNTAETVSKELGVKPEDVFYQADDKTYRGAKVWKIYYKDEDGIIRPYKQGDEGYWTVNLKDTPQYQEQLELSEKRKSEALEKARVIQRRDKELKRLEEENSATFKYMMGGSQQTYQSTTYPYNRQR